MLNAPKNLQTPSMFAHIHSDNRLIGSHLQGNTFNATTNYISSVIDLNLLRLKGNKEMTNKLEQLNLDCKSLIEIANQIAHAQTLSKLPEKIYSLKELQDKGINPIAESLMNKLTQNNGNLLIPGGWISPPETGEHGHAMLYQFTKLTESFYYFVIYNTGDGLQYHLKQSNLKDQYSPIKAYKFPEPKTAKDKKSLQQFIVELLTPQVAPALKTMWRQCAYGGTEKQEGWDNHKRYNSQRVYNNILFKVYLLSARELDPREIARITTRGQLSGTCCMRVLMPLLHVKLEDCFQEFSYKLQLQSIQDYFEQQQYRLKSPNDPAIHKDLPMIRRQLLQAIRRLGIRIKKMIGSATLTTTDADSDLRILEEIKKAVHEYKSSHAKKTTPSTNLLQINPFFDYQKPMESHFNIVLESAIIPPKKPVLESPKQKDYSDPLKFLKATYEINYSNNQEGFHEAVKTQIETLFLEFELNKHGYWHNLTEKNAQEALTYLQCILRLYGENCRQLNPIPSARQSITSYTGQLIAYDIVNQHYGNNKEAFRKVMASVFLSYKIPHGIDSVSLDPDFDKRLKQLNEIHREICAQNSEKENTQNNYDAIYFTNYFDETEKEQLKTIPCTKDSSSDMEKIRLNFYECLKSRPGIQINYNTREINISNASNLNEAYKYTTLPVIIYDNHWNFNPLYLAIERKDGSINQIDLSQNTTICDKVKQFCKDNKHGGFLGQKTNLFQSLVSEGLDTHKIDIFSKVSDKHQTNYDVFLQFKQIQEECSLITQAAYQYFKQANVTFGVDESKTRLSQLTSRSKYNEVQQIFFSFNTAVHYMGKYEFFCGPLVSKSQQDAKNPLLPTDCALQSILIISDEKNDSNSQMLTWEKIQKYTKHKISRTLPFTNHNKDCMCIATKNFFETNPELLNQDDYQKIALVNIFTPEVLEKQLSRDASFADKLIDFLQHTYTYHSREGKLSSGSVYTFELSYFLLKYLKKQSNNMSIIQSIKKIEHFNETLMQDASKKIHDKKTREKLMNIHFLIQSLAEKSSLDEKEIEVLFACSLQPIDQDPILDQEVLLAKQKMRPLIKSSFEQLKEEEKLYLVKKTITSNLPSELIPNLDTTTIYIEYPFVRITCPDEEVVIDLSLGKVQSSKGRHILTPPELMQDEYFNKLFGNSVLHVKQRVGGDYAIHEFNHEGITYRVLLHQKQMNIYIQRKFPGQSNWFEFIKTEQAPFVSSRYQNIECGWWCETDQPNDAIPSYYCISYQADSKEQSLLQLKLNIEKTHLICHELDQNGKSTNYQFLPINNAGNASIYELFSPFESEEHIEVWQNTQAYNALKIKLPRYDLEWIAREVIIEKNSQIEYSWSKNQDFKLLAFPPEVIEGFPNAIYMHNKKTDETIAWIPKQEFYVKDLKEKDGEYYALTYDINNSIPQTIVKEKNGDCNFHWNSLKSQQFGQFTIVNHEIFGNSVCDYLQLAYIALAKHDAEKAMWALQQCQKFGGIKGTEEEVGFIMKIMREIPNAEQNPAFYQKTMTKEPETLAVRLYAAWLLMEHKQTSLDTALFSDESKKKESNSGNEYYAQHVRKKISDFYEKEFINSVADIYASYHKVKGNIPDKMQLNITQCLSLLRKIAPTVTTLKNEMSTLELIHATEKKKYLLKVQAQKQTLGQRLSASDATLLEELNKTIETLSHFEHSEERLSEETREVTPLIVPFQFYGILSIEKQPLDQVLGINLNEDDLITHFALLYRWCQNKTSLNTPERANLVGQIENILRMENKGISPTILSIARILRYVIEYPDAEWPIYTNNDEHVFFYTLQKTCDTIYKQKPITIQTEVQSRTLHQGSRTKHTLATQETTNKLDLLFFEESQQISPVLQAFLTDLNNLKTPEMEKLDPIDVKFPGNINTLFEKKEQNKLQLEIQIAQSKKRIFQNKADFYKERLNQPKFQNDLFQYFQSFTKDSQNFLNQQKESILQHANFTILANKAEARAVVLGQTKSTLTFPDLIWLYLQGDFALFQQKTLLDPNAINQLYTEIYKYLVDSTNNQRNERILVLLEEIKTQHKEEDTQKCQKSLIKLGEVLSSPRHYKADEYPELLVFEFLEQASFRKEQVDTIQGLLEPLGDGFKNEIVQLTMGAGKSKFILPMLAVKKANGTNLSIVELPSHLFKPGFADLRQKTNKCFGKIGFPLIFDRDSHCNAANLQDLYQGLLDTMVNLEYVATTPESIQSLQLKYLELLGNPPKTLEEKTQVHYLEQILRTVQERGDAIIDECDTALDSKRELNYTLGSSGTVSNKILSSILAVYRTLKRCEVRPTGATTNNITLNDVLLRKVVLPTDADWDKAMESLAHKLVEAHNDTLPFLKELSKEEHLELCNYLLNRSKKIPTYVLIKINEEQRNAIAVVKGELDLLKTTLRKKPNEHYGFAVNPDYIGNKNIAIPYTFNNTPNERSQFGTVYEIINYTIQLHQQKGTLPKEIVHAFLDDFKTKARVELSKDPKTDLRHTEAAKQFNQIIGKPLQLEPHNPVDFAEILSDLEKKDIAFDYVLQHYLLNKVEQHLHILRSNAINHISQYRSAQGFTGTPWNVRCYHPKFHFDEKKHIGIDGETINLLIEKNPTVSFFEQSTPAEIIKNAIAKDQKDAQKIRAFLDVGAIFEGKSNLDIAILFAMQLKDNNSKMKQVLFFNENNELCSLQIDKVTSHNEKSLPNKAIIVIGSTDHKTIADKTGISADERFTYYHQSHTMAIDINQADDAIGITTLDLDSKARDCWQGVKRLMREEPSKQAVKFILPISVASKKPHLNGHWSVKDVIELVQESQINALPDLHLSSALDKMDDVVRQYFLEKIYNCRDLDEKIRLRKRYKEIFVSTITDEPFKKFGGIEQEMKVIDVLNQHKDICLKKIKSLLNKDSVDKNLEVALSNIAIESVQYCSTLYQRSGHLEKGSTLEIQKEQKKEKEKEIEKISHTMVDNKHAIPHRSWNGQFPQIPLTIRDTMPKITQLNTTIASHANGVTFSENILASENYINTYSSQSNPLDDLVKPVSFFLLIQDPSSLELKALLITQDEVAEFTHYLDKNKEQLMAAKKAIWIVSPHGNVQNTTSKAIEQSDPLYPSYSNLLSQIQFYNGDIHLFLEQKNFDWFFNENSQNKLRFLENVVLKNNPEKGKFFLKFHHEINRELILRLKQINVDIPAAYRAIDNDELQGIKTYCNALHFIKNPDLQTMAISYVPEEQSYSLLQYAIEKNNEGIIKILLQDDMVLSATRNTDHSPLMLLLKNHKQVQKIIFDVRFYPEPKERHAWLALFDKVMQQENMEIQDAFLEKMKNHCDKSSTHYLINQHIKALVHEPFAEERLKSLEDLAKLSNTPLIDVYGPYLLKAFECFSPSQIMSILSRFTDEPIPYPGLKEHTISLSRAITRPDVIIPILKNQWFIPDSHDVAAWAQLLKHQGVNIHISNIIATPDDKKRIPRLELNRTGNPQSLHYRTNAGVTEELRIYLCPEEIQQKLKQFVAAREGVSQQGHLNNQDPILNYLITCHSLSMVTDSELFILTKMLKSVSDKENRKKLINHPEVVRFISQTIAYLFPIQQTSVDQQTSKDQASYAPIMIGYLDILSDLLINSMVPGIENNVFWDDFFKRCELYRNQKLLLSEVLKKMIYFQDENISSPMPTENKAFLQRLTSLAVYCNPSTLTKVIHAINFSAPEWEELGTNLSKQIHNHCYLGDKNKKLFSLYKQGRSLTQYKNEEIEDFIRDYPDSEKLQEEIPKLPLNMRKTLLINLEYLYKNQYITIINKLLNTFDATDIPDSYKRKLKKSFEQHSCQLAKESIQECQKILIVMGDQHANQFDGNVNIHLERAIKNDSPQTIKILEEISSDVITAEQQFILANRYGSLKIIEALMLRYKYSLNTLLDNKIDGFPPLLYALKKPSHELFDKLLQLGAEPDVAVMKEAVHQNKLTFIANKNIKILHSNRDRIYDEMFEQALNEDKWDIVRWLMEQPFYPKIDFNHFAPIKEKNSFPEDIYEKILKDLAHNSEWSALEKIFNPNIPISDDLFETMMKGIQTNNFEYANFIPSQKLSLVLLPKYKEKIMQFASEKRWEELLTLLNIALTIAPLSKWLNSYEIKTLFTQATTAQKIAPVQKILLEQIGCVSLRHFHGNLEDYLRTKADLHTAKILVNLGTVNSEEDYKNLLFAACRDNSNMDFLEYASELHKQSPCANKYSLSDLINANQTNHYVLGRAIEENNSVNVQKLLGMGFKANIDVLKKVIPLNSDYDNQDNNHLIVSVMKENVLPNDLNILFEYLVKAESVEFLNVLFERLEESINHNYRIDLLRLIKSLENSSSSTTRKRLINAISSHLDDKDRFNQITLPTLEIVLKTFQQRNWSNAYDSLLNRLEQKKQVLVEKNIKEAQKQLFATVNNTNHDANAYREDITYSETKKNVALQLTIPAHQTLMNKIEINPKAPNANVILQTLDKQILVSATPDPSQLKKSTGLQSYGILAYKDSELISPTKEKIEKIMP